jgi:hypothetical protein
MTEQHQYTSPHPQTTICTAMSRDCLSMSVIHNIADARACPGAGHGCRVSRRGSDPRRGRSRVCIWNLVVDVDRLQPAAASPPSSPPHKRTLDEPSSRRCCLLLLCLLRTKKKKVLHFPIPTDCSALRSFRFRTLPCLAAAPRMPNEKSNTPGFASPFPLSLPAAYATSSTTPPALVILSSASLLTHRARTTSGISGIRPLPSTLE